MVTREGGLAQAGAGARGWPAYCEVVCVNASKGTATDVLAAL